MSASDKLADILRAIQGSVLEVKTSIAVNRMGTMTEVEDGAGRVLIDGMDDDTPCSLMVNANVGDRVTVEIVGNAAKVTGNYTAPPTDDTVADEAKAVAEATNQHFFTDTNGIHVTEATQEDWEENHSGANVLINSLGQLFRNGLNNLVSITSNATAFYDGVANAASNVVAQFGSFGAIIGKVASSHFAQTATGATFYGTSGTNKNLSIETHNDAGTISFNGDRSSISGFLNMLGLRSYGSSSSSDNGMITIAAESEDVNTASGTIGQSYIWLYSDPSIARVDITSLDGNGNGASVSVDGHNSAVNINGDVQLTNVLDPSCGGTGSDGYGTVKTTNVSTAISMASGSWATIGSVLLEGGTWFISYSAQYESNATGRRYICLMPTNETPSALYQRATGINANAVNGSSTLIHGAFVTSGNTEMYLKGWQNSGGALNTYGYIRAFRLK